jgi:DNA-binding SARP family transcriptional activator
MLELRLLGQFDVRLNDERVNVSSRPAQSLLAYLALSAGIAHRREKLACLLWPEADDENARSYLRHALWRLRKAIEIDSRQAAPYLLADELSVAFNARSAYWLDVSILERRVAGTATADELEHDLAVYRGELLPGFVDEWVATERDRLEAIFHRGMARLIDELSDQERWHDVVEAAERWISLGHSAEAAFRALMRAHAELGDRVRLATTYDRCRRALFEELGVEPSAQTRALYERLVHAEASRVIESETPPIVVTPAGNTPSPGTPPYKGLQSFDECDADLFFGRELAVARLFGRLSTDHVLAVVGASGSGKSSVVRAGLVPAWRDRSDSPPGSERPSTVLVLTPTSRPLESLATCLTRAATSLSTTARLVEELERDARGLRLYLRRDFPPSGRVLLVIDQLEELFTLCHDNFEREAFIDNVLGAVDGSIDLVVALRADFYANCAQYPSLRDALAQHQEYLGPMSSDELRRAIETPAHAAQWELEDGLVELLLRDVGEEPGGLPLLSHALLETWRRREGRRLTLRAYTASGGVQRAIAQTAEGVFSEQLSPEGQIIARKIFVELTELGENTQDTRRRARIDELLPPQADRASLCVMLNALADARLVTVGPETAEVAHEALIREWPRLRAWLDEDRAWLRAHRQLGEAAAEWERQAGDQDALYRGARLAQALEWRAEHAADLSALEHQFVEASRELAGREAAEREAQRRRELELERRNAGRLRLRAVYLGAAFVLALTMAGVALFFEQAS